MTAVVVSDPEHELITGEAWEGDHPVHGPAVFAPISCTCRSYSNLVSGKNAFALVREAKKVHAKHVIAMGEQE